MTATIGGRRLIPAREAAHLLDVHPETLRRLVRDGRLGAVRLRPGGWLRFEPRELERFVRENAEPGR